MKKQEIIIFTDNLNFLQACNLGVQQNQAWFIWYDDMPFDITTKASYFIF